MKYLTLVLLFCLSLPSSAASILLYHHVSSTTPKSTSVSLEVFQQHLDMISELGLEVVPLTTITDAIKNGQPVDHNWTAITFDDGFRSVFDNAYPELKRRNMPFTVFVNPNMVKPSKLYMSWPQIKTLADDGVIIANHTLAHENLVRDGLTISEIVANIEQAEEMIVQQLGQNHKMLAFPFGEYNQTLEEKLTELGYVGFAQHSGAVNHTSNLTALTRFPANGIYANPKTLKNKMRSLPFNIKSISPIDTKPNSPQPKLQVALEDRDFYQSQLACFISGTSQPQKPIWTAKNVFEIAANNAIPPGRVKYNCTAPSIKHSGRFYWMSKLWINQQ